MFNWLKGVATVAALAMSLASTSNAALLEVDVSALYMSDDKNGNGCCYRPTGTFEFDTNTQLVSNVNVSSIFETYSFGSFDANFDAFGLFSTNSDLVLDIVFFSFNDLLNDIATAVVGDSFFCSADPTEFDNVTAEVYGTPVDPTLVVTVLDLGSTPAVPLPAGLPLLLTALGGFALMRRKG